MFLSEDRDKAIKELSAGSGHSTIWSLALIAHLFIKYSLLMGSPPQVRDSLPIVYEPGTD